MDCGCTTSMKEREKPEYLFFCMTHGIRPLLCVVRPPSQAIVAGRGTFPHLPDTAAAPSILIKKSQLLLPVFDYYPTSFPLLEIDQPGGLTSRLRLGPVTVLLDGQVANRALELLGKHLRMFPDQKEHSGPNDGPIQGDH